MSTDYTGYGQGSNGYGQGFAGSLYGGDPGGGGYMSPGGPGGTGPIPAPGLSNPGGMRPGEGLHQRPQPGGMQGMGGLKPILSQLFGFSPQMGFGPRPMPQHNPNMYPPIVRSPVMRATPIQRSPVMRGRPIPSQPGRRMQPGPIQRPGGGTMTPDRTPGYGSATMPTGRGGPGYTQ